MKNLIFILLGVFIYPTTYAQVRKKEEIQKNPMDISEYFLIMPSEKNWKMEGDETDSFIGRQKYFKAAPKRTVTIDKKNAYLTISDISNELEFRFTMCYFIKKDKTRVIAVKYYSEGGDCDDHMLKFYTYTSFKWQDVTKEVLPIVSLKNLKVQEKDRIPVDFVYTLPQYGTDINVKVEAVCEQANRLGGKDYMAYFEQFKKLPFKNLQLKWNKEKGFFESGEIK